MHIFDLYRRALLVVISVYTVVRLCQSAGGWTGQLTGVSRQSRLMRSYLAAMLLSVRIRRFWADLIQILLLLTLLGAMVYAHRFVME